jgi:hypothetical protein
MAHVRFSDWRIILRAADNQFHSVGHIISDIGVLHFNCYARPIEIANMKHETFR